MAKHKYYDEIVSFANGYKIDIRESKYSDVYVPLEEPHFDTINEEYRVRPVEQKYRALIHIGASEFRLSMRFYSSEDEYYNDNPSTTTKFVQLITNLPPEDVEVTPHKFKEFMIAFASGDAVQVSIDYSWVDVTKFSMFYDADECRMKPKLPRYKVLYTIGPSYIVSDEYYESEFDFKNKSCDGCFVQLLTNLPEPT